MPVSQKNYVFGSFKVFFFGLLYVAYSDLPAFLVKNGGLNSGYMMAHCTAAALVSENKGLCHPSSVDSLSTSAGQEDHVSMGGWAARKVI